MIISKSFAGNNLSRSMKNGLRNANVAAQRRNFSFPLLPNEANEAMGVLHQYWKSSKIEESNKAGERMGEKIFDDALEKLIRKRQDMTVESHFLMLEILAEKELYQNSITFLAPILDDMEYLPLDFLMPLVKYYKQFYAVSPSSNNSMHQKFLSSILKVLYNDYHHLTLQDFSETFPFALELYLSEEGRKDSKNDFLIQETANNLFNDIKGEKLMQEFSTVAPILTSLCRFFHQKNNPIIYKEFDANDFCTVSESILSSPNHSQQSQLALSTQYLKCIKNVLQHKNLMHDFLTTNQNSPKGDRTEKVRHEMDLPFNADKIKGHQKFVLGKAIPVLEETANHIEKILMQYPSRERDASWTEFLMESLKFTSYVSSFRFFDGDRSHCSSFQNLVKKSTLLTGNICQEIKLETANLANEEAANVLVLYKKFCINFSRMRKILIKNSTFYDKFSGDDKIHQQFMNFLYSYPSLPNNHNPSIVNRDVSSLSKQLNFDGEFLEILISKINSGAQSSTFTVSVLNAVSGILETSGRRLLRDVKPIRPVSVHPLMQIVNDLRKEETAKHLHQKEITIKKSDDDMTREHQEIEKLGLQFLSAPGSLDEAIVQEPRRGDEIEIRARREKEKQGEEREKREKDEKMMETMKLKRIHRKLAKINASKNWSSFFVGGEHVRTICDQLMKKIETAIDHKVRNKDMMETSAEFISTITEYLWIASKIGIELPLSLYIKIFSILRENYTFLTEKSMHHLLYGVSANSVLIPEEFAATVRHWIHQEIGNVRNSYLVSLLSSCSCQKFVMDEETLSIIAKTITERVRTLSPSQLVICSLALCRLQEKKAILDVYEAIAPLLSSLSSSQRVSVLSSICANNAAIAPIDLVGSLLSLLAEDCAALTEKDTISVLLSLSSLSPHSSPTLETLRGPFRGRYLSLVPSLPLPLLSKTLSSLPSLHLNQQELASIHDQLETSLLCLLTANGEVDSKKAETIETSAFLRIIMSLPNFDDCGSQVVRNTAQKLLAPRISLLTGEQSLLLVHALCELGSSLPICRRPLRTRLRYLTSNYMIPMSLLVKFSEKFDELGILSRLSQDTQLAIRSRCAPEVRNRLSPLINFTTPQFARERSQRKTLENIFDESIIKKDIIKITKNFSSKSHAQRDESFAVNKSTPLSLWVQQTLRQILH